MRIDSDAAAPASELSPQEVGRKGSYETVVAQPPPRHGNALSEAAQLKWTAFALEHALRTLRQSQVLHT